MEAMKPKIKKNIDADTDGDVEANIEENVDANIEKQIEKGSKKTSSPQIISGEFSKTIVLNRSGGLVRVFEVPDNMSARLYGFMVTARLEWRGTIIISTDAIGDNYYTILSGKSGITGPASAGVSIGPSIFRGGTPGASVIIDSSEHDCELTVAISGIVE